jgi:hypothetical protein
MVSTVVGQSLLDVVVLLRGAKLITKFVGRGNHFSTI